MTTVHSPQRVDRVVVPDDVPALTVHTRTGGTFLAIAGLSAPDPPDGRQARAHGADSGTISAAGTAL